jgi:hypothetical protein
MTPIEKKALTNANAVVLAKMANNAAGMVKSLLIDLGANETWIRLNSPESHRVGYEFVKGNAKFIAECAEDLGLTVTATTIKVADD